MIVTGHALSSDSHGAYMPTKAKPKTKRLQKPFTIYLEPDKLEELEKLKDEYARNVSKKINGPFKTSVADFVRRLIDAYGKTFAKG